MAKTPSSRGGSRPGAGRTPGTGTYGEPTQPIRVPVSLLPIVRAWLSARGKAPPRDASYPAPSRATRPLPLFSSWVAAGFPSPADDHLEDHLDLNEHLVRHPAATFLVRVQGDSMIGAGIQHGDLLVVDRSLEPKSGTIVIAVVNGELTVKRLKADSGGVWLVPENPNYPRLEIREGMDLTIWGVVVHVVHSL
jgi:DNA polymerase V